MQREFIPFSQYFILDGTAAMTIYNITQAIGSRLQSPLAESTLFGLEKLDAHYFVEAALLLIIGYFMFSKSHEPKKKPLTQQEIDQLCDEWVPEPLYPSTTEDDLGPEPPVLSSAAGVRTTVNGKDVLNLSSTNFLGLIGHPKIADVSEKALVKYGVGACGPRGFYGTIDVHLDIEAKIAAFLGTEDAILYSYGLATAASAIPAFCKRGDLLIADEGLSWGIQNGLQLSRSSVRWFKHNDMADLEQKLMLVKEEDRRRRKALNRRFIVVEGIYQNSGQMLPLDRIIELKEKYRFRVLVDESLSLGVLGKTGRGITEQFAIPVAKIDILTASLGNAIASFGGFCAGSRSMVSHQRLSGAGYCFSASLPPYLASASITSLEILEESPHLLTKLQHNINVFRKAALKIPGVTVMSDPQSPLVHLQLKKSVGSVEDDSALLQRVADAVLSEADVLLSVKKFSFLDRCRLPASLKVAISAGHEEGALLKAAAALKSEFHNALHSWKVEI